MILPPPLQRYFDANAALDLDAMVAPFAETAIVQDESRVHEGKDAIRAWIQQASIAASAIAAPKVPMPINKIALDRTFSSASPRLRS